MGSPSFMAPEIWSGETDRVDQRADVYSLAVILFRILAGSLPFAGQTLREKFLGTTSEERPSLFAKRPDLPADADAWVAQALAIEPEQRFRNVRALWNAFLTTFDIPDPKGRRSLWAAAKGMVLRIAGAHEQPPLDMSAWPAMDAAAPSFTSEALARSIMIVDDGAESLDLFGTHKDPPLVAPQPEAAPEPAAEAAAPEPTPDGPQDFANRPAPDSEPRIP